MPVFHQIETNGQGKLFRSNEAESAKEAADSSTFQSNMGRPVHRWFRYSAGFSAAWVEKVIRESGLQGVKVFDPFAGSGTTLLAAQAAGAESWGLEAHPFIFRVAKAKLEWNASPEAYAAMFERVSALAAHLTPSLEFYPDLIRRCFEDETLLYLDRFRRAFELVQEDSPASDLVWLTLVSALRKMSTAGTAQWQYILPNQPKKSPMAPAKAMLQAFTMIRNDMDFVSSHAHIKAHLLRGDARTCEGMADNSINLIVTSPPYPNNYDYADATRLEMSFLGEVAGWGDLQGKVRQFLMRSCSQHTPEKSHTVDDLLNTPAIDPIRSEIEKVCSELALVRETKGGRKSYHLMIAAYFRDISAVWLALRRVCTSPSHICFVIGDSAPYGVYVPVVQWMERLAITAGFTDCVFEKTRDRNTKWKNRKHQVPLLEGRLWVKG